MSNRYPYTAVFFVLNAIFFSLQWHFNFEFEWSIIYFLAIPILVIAFFLEHLSLVYYLFRKNKPKNLHMSILINIVGYLILVLFLLILPHTKFKSNYLPNKFSTDTLNPIIGYFADKKPLILYSKNRNFLINVFVEPRMSFGTGFTIYGFYDSKGILLDEFRLPEEYHGNKVCWLDDDTILFESEMLNPKKIEDIQKNIYNIKIRFEKTIHMRNNMCTFNSSK